MSAIIERLALGVYLITFTGCPQPPGPVTPPTPDASDASGPSLMDAAPEPMPNTPCGAACIELHALGCTEGFSPMCYRSLSHIDSARVIREPNGKPLTCQDIASVTSVAEVRALGIYCAP